MFTIDNRCPHIGFPIERSSVADGILTCHWHEARFELESGCSFDLWADTPNLTETVGSEASTSSHHPVEIVEPLRAADRALPSSWPRAGAAPSCWILNLYLRIDALSPEEDPGLVDTLRGDDSIAIIEALKEALAAGGPHRGLASCCRFGLNRQRSNI